MSKNYGPFRRDSKFKFWIFSLGDLSFKKSSEKWLGKSINFSYQRLFKIGRGGNSLLKRIRNWRNFKRFWFLARSSISYKAKPFDSFDQK